MTGSEQYTVLGIISGSSLDGLDLTIVDFEFSRDMNPIKSWTIRKAQTIPFSEDLIAELRNITTGFALDLVDLDHQLGTFFAECCLSFIENEQVDFIANHGHTVFHHPCQSSTQIANSALIAAKTGIPTIGHLRNMDTAYGGQGAPLAPMADLYLFQDYDVCINLGGIANISIKSGNGIIGYDLCGANQILNHLSNKKGLEYDDGGRIARSGKVDSTLLDQMNALPYCIQDAPKSLDNQQTKTMYLPLLEASTAIHEDLMRTMVQHIVDQIISNIPDTSCQVLLTGGGALNTFLVDTLNKQSHKDTAIIVPDQQIIEFKEATLIAMCGLLRIKELPNSLSSITGASKDTINGVVYLP